VVNLPRSRLLDLKPAIRRWGHPEFSQIALRI
jgi:hypothetical protein